MRHNKGIVRRVFTGRKRHAAPSTTNRRRLTIERLEDRTLLAGITVSGTVMLATGGAGTPVRNAMVWVAIPVTYTDASKNAYQTVLPSDSTFTDGAGAFTVDVDNTPPTGCTAYQLDQNGAITVYVTAKAPTLTPGTDPINLKPAYSVVDGLLNPYEEDYVGQPIQLPGNLNQANVSVTIGPKGGSSFTVIDNNSYVDTYNAMTAFTVLATYWGYATQAFQIPWGAAPNAKLVNPLEVLYPCGGDRSGFMPGIPLSSPPGITDPEILLSQTEFALDAKAVGAGFGEYLACEEGWLRPSVSVTPSFLANDRLRTNDSATQSLTPNDVNLAFGQGFGDWYAVSAAVNSGDASVLSALPGFGAGQTHSFDGNSLDKPGGGGEDEELSVAKILWTLDCDGVNNLCHQYDDGDFLTLCYGGSLYCLYNSVLALLSNVNDQMSNLDFLGRIFAAQDVAPSAEGTDFTSGTPTFTFWVPITGDPTDAATQAAFPLATARFTFDSVELDVFDPAGSNVLTKPFSLDSVPFSGQRPNNAALEGMGLTVNQTLPATATHGAWMKLSWTVPAADWAKAVKQMTGARDLCSWTVTGTTQYDVGRRLASAYVSQEKNFDYNTAEIDPTSFLATSAGNNTLDLTYNIVSPDGTPGGTLDGVNVTLYASPSGVFDYSDNVQIAPIYSVTDPDLLSGSDTKVFSMGADFIGCGGYGAALQEFEFSSSELYVLAKVDTTVGENVDTQWVRLQAGAFQAYDNIMYVFGTASLDDPTPDDNVADTFTITNVPGTSVSITGPSGDGIAADTFTRIFAADPFYSNLVYVRGHGGDDTVDASALTYDEDTNPVSLTVLDGSGHDTISAGLCGTLVYAGSGGFSFTGPAGFGGARSVVCGQAEFYFAGDSSLGSSDITITGPGAVGLNFFGLGQGINLDLGQTGQQTLNSLVSLSLSLDGSQCGVGGTCYGQVLSLAA